MANAEEPLPSTSIREPIGAGGPRPQDTSQVPQFEPFDTETAMNTLLERLPKPTTAKDWWDNINHVPEGNKDTGWQNCFKVVEKHDKDLCQAYREQIDTLLVFAGLFSAVVTAFSVESYQWLQDDPADTSVVLLRDVVLLMSQTANRTVEAPPLKPSRLTEGVIVRINVFWFVSLCLSLSAALVGILCKQWLREYERDVGQLPKKALAVRHVRFQGLESWKVGTIVTSVPIILQLALALFLLGVVDLLWRLHVAVAGCVTTVVALTMAFYLSTTFLPLIQYAYICLQCCRAVYPTEFPGKLGAFEAPQCAFKSAQAWIAISLAQPLIEYCLKAYALCFAECPPHELSPLELPRADSWVRFDINWTRRREYLRCGPSPAYASLSWAAKQLDEVDLGVWIWHCVWSHRWGSLGPVEYTFEAAEDISCVADAYPKLMRLGIDFQAHVRTQSLAFHCSLRAGVPADTVLELLLRISYTAGVNSQWTQEALNAVVTLYDQHPLHISDDVAMGLLYLAERQSCEQWETEIQILTDARNPHFPFLQIANLLSRGSRLRAHLLPAMCALGVPWLGVQSRDSVKMMARDLLGFTIEYYAVHGYNDQQLLEAPGVLLAARFAYITIAIWPDLPRWWVYRHAQERILFALLSIWSSRDRSAEPAGNTPSQVPSGVRAGSAPERLATNSRDDVRITVHETQIPTQETDLNRAASPQEGLSDED